MIQIPSIQQKYRILHYTSKNYHHQQLYPNPDYENPIASNNPYFHSHYTHNPSTILIITSHPNNMSTSNQSDNKSACSMLAELSQLRIDQAQALTQLINLH